MASYSAGGTARITRRTRHGRRRLQALQTQEALTPTEQTQKVRTPATGPERVQTTTAPPPPYVAPYVGAGSAHLIPSGDCRAGTDCNTVATGLSALGGTAAAAVACAATGFIACVTALAEGELAAASGGSVGLGGLVAGGTRSRIVANPAARACACLIAGTEVQTSNGPVAIENIRPGDEVWARNLQTGQSELRKVIGLFRKTSTTLMTVTLATGATVVVTEQHPFMVDGEGWVMSGDLKVGDRLTQRDGGAAAITEVTVRSGEQTVYNFEVAQDHNYYVTDAQLLVHNCPDGARALSPNLMNRLTQRDQAPAGRKRVDIGKVPGEQTHIHFDDGVGAQRGRHLEAWRNEHYETAG